MEIKEVFFEYFFTKNFHFGILGGVFWVWFLVWKISKLYFGSEISLLGGLFYKTFWFEASLYMFLIFWKSRVFLSLVFENFESEFPLLGVCFIKLLVLRPPYIWFWYFGNLGGLFWVWFWVFENFEIVLWIRIPIFGGACLIKLFDLRPPCRGDRYGHLDTLNIKIRPSYQEI